MPTGSPARRSGSTKEKREQRRAEAGVWLLVRGMGWNDIAVHLSYNSAAVAQKQIEDYMASMAGPVEKENARRIVNMQLMQLMQSVYGKAMNADNPEHLPAVKVFLQIQERYAKANGLDAPTEMAIINPTHGTLMAVVEELARRQMGGHDVIEAEIVPEGYEDGKRAIEPRPDDVLGGAGAPGAPYRVWAGPQAADPAMPGAVGPALDVGVHPQGAGGGDRADAGDPGGPDPR